MITMMIIHSLILLHFLLFVLYNYCCDDDDDDDDDRMLELLPSCHLLLTRPPPAPLSAGHRTPKDRRAVSCNFLHANERCIIAQSLFVRHPTDTEEFGWIDESMFPHTFVFICTCAYVCYILDGKAKFSRFGWQREGWKNWSVRRHSGRGQESKWDNA